MPMITPGERLWLTADKDRVVPDGDPDAATLYCTETDEVDADEAQRLGLKQRKATAETKETRPTADKADDSDDQGDEPDAGKPARGGRARK